MTTSTTGTLRTEQWRERIAQQAASGKSVAAFCQEQGIATQTFYWWRNRLVKCEAGAVPPPVAAAASSFLDLGAMPVAAQGSESLSIRLELPGGITLTIARS